MVPGCTNGAGRGGRSRMWLSPRPSLYHHGGGRSWGRHQRRRRAGEWREQRRHGRGGAAAALRAGIETVQQGKQRPGARTNQNKEGSSPLPQGRQGLITRDGVLRRQTPSLQMPSLPSSPRYIAEHKAIWSGISYGSAGTSCPGCVLSQLLVSLSLLGWDEEQRRPWLRVNPDQQ